MSNKPLGLRERNRIRTRDDILHAMSTLLGESAYENISIDDIAKRAGVSRGTIYTYFPDGRDQLVRDAYLQISTAVSNDGTARRERCTGFTDRIVAVATAFATVAATPEGRFYGAMGAGTIGPLNGVTGTASSLFLRHITADVKQAKADGLLDSPADTEDLALLLSGSLREIGLAVSRDPSRAESLLSALRISCDRMLRQDKEHVEQS
ncbi:MAG: TetR/AcrR family transcriptional regulator [Microbacterium sp.]|uniref:TetR/AcrR family transcriptional regulator n=1 Tax=Microbacterium sp. TaxID=51671 RepID=UPI0039E59633